MKNKELLELMSNLNACSDLIGVKFAYGVARNKSMLKGLIESLDEATKPSKEFSEYDQQRMELAKKYSQKDENGEPKTEVVDNFGNSKFVMEDEKTFNVELEKLRKKYKKALDERKKQDDDFQALLEEESKFKPYLIEEKDIPKDISAGQLSGIFEIIK